MFKVITNSLISNNFKQLLPLLKYSTRSNALNLELPEPVKLSSHKTDGTDLANEEPIIISHGLFGSKNNWRGLARRIAEATKRTVYTVDLRNHGDSPHTDGKSANYLGMAADLREFLDDINSETAYFIGHSMGGRAVFQLAFLFPEVVTKLASVDVSPISEVGPQTHSEFIQYVASMKAAVNTINEANAKQEVSMSDGRKKVDAMISNSVKDKFIRDFLIMNLVKDDSTQFRWKFNLDALRTILEKNYLNQFEYEMMQRFEKPALFIWGDKSNYMNPDDFPRIRVRFPNSTFKKIEGAGHYLHVQKQEEFLAALIPFLNEKVEEDEIKPKPLFIE